MRFMLGLTRRVGASGTFLLAPSLGLAKLNQSWEEQRFVGARVYLCLSRELCAPKNTSLSI